MDRKAFFRNLFGAVAAVTIAPVLDKVSIAPKEKLVATYHSKGIIQQIQENGVYHKYEGGQWMTQHMHDAMQAHMHEVEMRMWYGKPGDNNRT